MYTSKLESKWAESSAESPQFPARGLDKKFEKAQLHDKDKDMEVCKLDLTNTAWQKSADVVLSCPCRTNGM